MSEISNIIKNHVPKKVDKPNNKTASKGSEKDFEKILKNHFHQKESTDIKISKHASKRLAERNIEIGSDELVKLKEAAGMLRAKGGRESLIITDNAAYIVDVNKNTLITAMNKGKMDENVVTNIDSTIFV